MAYRPYIWRKNNSEKRTIQKRRENVRRKLRVRGYLPPVGTPMSEEQNKIYKQIGDDDYTFWDSVKLKPGNEGGKVNQRTSIKSPEYRIWYRAKDNAKSRGYEFNLELEDIEIPIFCPYLNVPLITEFDENHHDYYFSIDRKDSSKGYVKGNIQVISHLANSMKSSATEEQLITFAKSVLSTT